MTQNSQIRPFRIAIPQTELDDVRARLANTRWTQELPRDQITDGVQKGPVPPGWELGVPLDYVHRLVAYWLEEFDWRATEAALNEIPQFTTSIDGQNIHFLHVRSADPDAVPLILTHGWPNCFYEYTGVLSALTDPEGPGTPFHLVVPDTPGFGFSGPTTEKGWNHLRTARAWAELMHRLGYERYGAAGNDGGSMISPLVGREDPSRVIGVHVTQIFSFPSGDPAEFEGLPPEDFGKLQFLQSFNDEMSGYMQLQNTKPQNLAHALADSPAGQLAWIGQLLMDSLSPQDICALASIYWYTNTGASSARMYYEVAHQPPASQPTTLPLGLAQFANDFQSIRRFAERDHANIVSWNVYDRGSHWSAHDAPDLLVTDLRQFFGKLR
ncbi:MAG TPA: epoxide hydrolase [Streptosporangiaceae bacterium]|nr:epoxide hydrolase [Streptosporangiaceae bacterium]